jgi:hypothetical protein
MDGNHTDVSPSPAKPLETLSAKERRAAYYAANKDKVRAKQNEYYQANREKILEKQRMHRALVKEVLAAKAATVSE